LELRLEMLEGLVGEPECRLPEETLKKGLFCKDEILGIWARDEGEVCDS